MSTSSIDEAFLPFSAFVKALADIDGAVGDPGKGIAMTVEWTEINMPVEIDVVVDDAGVVTLGAVPPLYYVETTVMPVFHQITLTMEAMPEENHGH